MGWNIYDLKESYHIISAVDFFTNGIQALQHPWKKCVNRKKWGLCWKMNLTWLHSTYFGQPVNFSVDPHKYSLMIAEVKN